MLFSDDEGRDPPCATQARALEKGYIQAWIAGGEEKKEGGVGGHHVYSVVGVLAVVCCSGVMQWGVVECVVACAAACVVAHEPTMYTHIQCVFSSSSSFCRHDVSHPILI